MAEPTKRRYHDLDALRAFAMLLGIILHGLLSFVPIPIWPAQDVRQSEAWWMLLHAIHGFRMPVFFLISGFFTAMLWKQRGLNELIRHRAKRILLPMVAFGAVIIPAMYAVGFYAVVSRSVDSGPGSIWAAARSGDTELLRRRLEAGVDVNAKDGKQATPLHWAAVRGRTEAAQLLIEEGADPNAKDGNGSTPLHWAAFFGEPESVKLLIEKGADPGARNKSGETPLDAASSKWNEVRPIALGIAAVLDLEIDEERVKAGRSEAGRLLAEHAAPAQDEPELFGQLPGWAQGIAFVIGILFVAAVIPVFHHLWFLYYLVWLFAIFALLAWIGGKRRWKPWPAWVVASPLRWLWIVPITLVPQIFMFMSFGADTAVGLIPWPPKLLYYGVFFGFGLICFGKPEFERKVGRYWLVSFVCAVPVLLLGVYWYDLRNELFGKGFSEHAADIVGTHALTSLCSVVYTWLMIFGLLGFFRRLFTNANRKIRYVSDSSYWLYLTHLPLIILLQLWLSSWDQPGPLKFLLICAVVTGFLLLIYDLAVRYTWVGAMLNGRRTRGG